MLRVLILLLLAAACPAQTAAPLFSEVDGILQELSHMTGWKVKRKVPSEVLPKEKFAALLLEEVARSLETSDPPALEEELRALDLLRYCRSALERRRTDAS